MAKRKSGKKRKARGSYLTPGVYVDEVSSGSWPIEAVGTAVAAFVGLAPANPRRAAAVILVAAAVVWAARNRLS